MGLYASLVGFGACQLKVPQNGMCSLATDLGLSSYFFYQPKFHEMKISGSGSSAAFVCFEHCRSVCLCLTASKSKAIFTRLHTQVGTIPMRSCVVFGESRSKLNQDIGQSFKIQHSEMVSNCLHFHCRGAVVEALYS